MTHAEICAAINAAIEGAVRATQYIEPYIATWNAAIEHAAGATERYALRSDDIRRAALEMCAENIRTLKAPT